MPDYGGIRHSSYMRKDATAIVCACAMIRIFFDDPGSLQNMERGVPLMGSHLKLHSTAERARPIEMRQKARDRGPHHPEHGAEFYFPYLLVGMKPDLDAMECIDGVSGLNHRPADHLKNVVAFLIIQTVRGCPMAGAGRVMRIQGMQRDAIRVGKMSPPTSGPPRDLMPLRGAIAATTVSTKACPTIGEKATRLVSLTRFAA